MTTIGYDTFQQLELRVGKVLAAEAVAGARKLVALTVDIGREIRLVAGIREHYEPEALVGRLIVVLANLEPRIVFGLESQGMLLATRDAGSARVALLAVDGAVAPGSPIS